MGEFRLPLRSDYPSDAEEKWTECCLCGARLRTAIVYFDSGSVEPTADSYSAGEWTGGETITGATSGDTGVVHRITRTAGAWADGDAEGVIILRSPTGYDASQLSIFENDELLNGATAGNNFATVNGTGALSISGRLIADKDIVHYQGRDYCRAHFKFKFAHEWDDENIPDHDENDREE